MQSQTLNLTCKLLSQDDVNKTERKKHKHSDDDILANSEIWGCGKVVERIKERCCQDRMAGGGEPSRAKVATPLEHVAVLLSS